MLDTEWRSWQSGTPNLKNIERWLRESVAMQLTGRHYSRARRLLSEVVTQLDKSEITYHLEGGTLLGIVRDGDLLPWDEDLDLSIPSSAVDSFLKKAVIPLRLRGWRVSVHRFEDDGIAWRKGQVRIIKVRNRSWLFLRGTMCLDIFPKYEADDFAWWTAKRKIMRVPSRFYAGREWVAFGGRSWSVPADYREYLALKYGDWQVPVKTWDCASCEATVIGDLYTAGTKVVAGALLALVSPELAELADGLRHAI